MNIPINHRLIYLDQNVLSHLRSGKQARKSLLAWLIKLKNATNGVYVYSMTHVDECRGASHPEGFVEVMEELPVYLMEFENAWDTQYTLDQGRERDLILEPEDEIHQVSRQIEDISQVFSFASGWSNEKSAKKLKAEMTEEVDALWNDLIRNHDWDVFGTKIGYLAKLLMEEWQEKMSEIIKNLALGRIKRDWEKVMTKLKQGLPGNLAQLDEVPDKDAVSFVFSCIVENVKAAVERQYPQGFWSTLDGRKTGDLAGLGLMLFMCGLVRDSRVKKGSRDRRLQYFRGQYRDGVHIENASRCEFFVTFDKRAVRLARCLYSFAGVKTNVIALSVPR